VPIFNRFGVDESGVSECVCARGCLCVSVSVSIQQYIRARSQVALLIAKLNQKYSNRLNAVFGMKLLAETFCFAVETVRFVNRISDVADVEISIDELVLHMSWDDSDVLLVDTRTHTMAL
jgi:hypothetical protein